MKKALIVSHAMNDATSYYRAAGAFAYLKCDNWQFDYLDLETNPVPSTNWSIFTPYSLVYLQRPHTDQELILMRKVKELGIKVWVDYDDALFDIPLGNPLYEYYRHLDTQKKVDNCIRYADYATCSTEGVKEHFQGRRPNPIKVIPNAWNDITRGEKRETPTEFKSQWVWRGSSSHSPDLHESTPEFKKVLDKYETHTHIFWGATHWPLLQACNYQGEGDPRFSLLEPNTPPTYIEFLSRNRAIDNCGRFGVVPLVDNSFNRAKSNIAWFEFTYSNIVTIAPAFGEWQKPGIVNYTKDQGLADTYFDLAEHGDPVSQIDTSWDYIMDNYRLSKINLLRYNLLQEAYDSTL